MMPIDECRDKFCPIAGRDLDEEDCFILSEFNQVREHLLTKDPSLTELGATVNAWIALMKL